jgi:predicted small integral membrane protein
MAVRLSKIALVAAIGLLALMIVVNNVTDHDANFRYIYHVLTMDTVFPDNQLTWRAIREPILQRLAYGTIIATESAIALLCFLGAIRLFIALKQPATVFNQAKNIAIYGLTLAFLFWFVGFMVIGGEWFTMWQSADWNGQQPAFRFIGCVGIVLLYLNQPDEELNG